jgi:hypothetical protein
MAEGRRDKGQKQRKERERREERRRSDGSDANPFIVEDAKKKEEIDERKDMKTSEEIKIFNVGDAPVIDYVKDEEQTVIEYDEKSDVIEIKADSMEYLDITKAKTVEVDGRKPRKDLDKKVKADFTSLKQSKYDEQQIFRDIQRNIEEYRPLCRFCRSSMKCHKCGGKGKKMGLFKCQECKGSGMCTHCGELKDVKCPKCRTKISIYATHCQKCGAAFSCPSCFSPLPSTSTRCLSCRIEFYCARCKGIIVPAVDEKCPRCGEEKWFKQPKKEMPIRKEERGKEERREERR